MRARQVGLEFVDGHPLHLLHQEVDRGQRVRVEGEHRLSSSELFHPGPHCRQAAAQERVDVDASGPYAGIKHETRRDGQRQIPWPASLARKPAQLPPARAAHRSAVLGWMSSRSDTAASR